MAQIPSTGDLTGAVESQSPSKASFEYGRKDWYLRRLTHFGYAKVDYD